MKQKLNCVLLIDDDNATNFLNKWTIERTNSANQIFIKKNGALALDFLSKAVDGKYPKPDLIFLDINMPVMNGWEFMDEYKKLPAEQKGKIVIVMLTTSPNPDHLKKAQSIPEIDGYERKPLNIKMLEHILAKYF